LSYLADESVSTRFKRRDRPVARPPGLDARRNFALRGRMAKILIVDDDPKARTLLVDLLEYDGHVVIECGNGMDGLKAVARENPDLVICDSNMPGMSGSRFIAELRKQTQPLCTPFIFHTASGDDSEIRRVAATYGVASILTKPCPARLILAEIRSVLAALPQNPVPAPPERLRARIPGYLASCDADVAAIQFALAAGDLVRIQALSHNLKGTGSAYGFSRITRLGDQLESAAKAGDNTEIAEQLRNLARYLADIRATTSVHSDGIEARARCLSGKQDVECQSGPGSQPVERLT
jgi:CheY-like chemotaxis protein/HPt (histidine-containing phosphotransfer) domain-containing protein